MWRGMYKMSDEDTTKSATGMAYDNDKANRNTLRVCGLVGLCCKSANICWALTRWPDKHKYYFALHFHWFVTHLATGWHLINFCSRLGLVSTTHIQPKAPSINQSNSQTHGSSLCHGSVANATKSLPTASANGKWKMEYGKLEHMQRAGYNVCSPCQLLCRLSFACVSIFWVLRIVGESKRSRELMNATVN